MKSKYLSLTFWQDVPAGLAVVCYFGNSTKLAQDKQNTETETTSNSVGFSEVMGSAQNLTIAGDKNKIEMSDYNAVDKSFEFATSALSQNAIALKAVSDNSESFAQELKSFAESQSTNNDQRMYELGKWVFGGLAVVAGFKFWSDTKK